MLGDPPDGHRLPVDVAASPRRHGLEWIEPPAAFAQPQDDGGAAIVRRSVPATAETLGADALAYRRIMEPLVRDADLRTNTFLGPVRIAFVLNAMRLPRFGLQAIQPGRLLRAAPLPDRLRGGSQAIADATAAYKRQLGREIVVDHRCDGWRRSHRPMPSCSI